MRVEVKHQQATPVGIVGHVQEQVLPMLQADRVAAYTAQAGGRRTVAQERQIRKADKRALARGVKAVS
jgi:hypothetical protein